MAFGLRPVCSHGATEADEAESVCIFEICRRLKERRLRPISPSRLNCTWTWAKVVHRQCKHSKSNDPQPRVYPFCSPSLYSMYVWGDNFHFELRLLLLTANSYGHAEQNQEKAAQTQRLTSYSFQAKNICVFTKIRHSLQNREKKIRKLTESLWKGAVKHSK